MASKTTERFIIVFFLAILALSILFARGVFRQCNTAVAPVKYGFINTEGKCVIPFEFDSVGDFHNGFAATSRNGQIRMINRKGEVESIPVVWYKKDTLLNQHNQTTSSSEEYVSLNKPWVRIGPVQFGKALFRIRRGATPPPADGKPASFDFAYSFIDQTNQNTKPLIFDQAFPFSDSLARVCGNAQWIGKRNYPRSNWGFIHPDGTYAARPVYFKAHSFSEGLAAVGILTNYHKH